MPFVKLDCGMLDSTLWFDREAREVFITALLMAEPIELDEPTPEICIRSLEWSGWKVPPGRYGLVPAASIGIIGRARVEQEAGLEALERLRLPEASSRSQDFEGRRLVRIDGGFLVLNFQRYRDRDYTAAARSRRYREKKKSASHAVTGGRHAVAGRNVTQAEAEAEAETTDLSVSPTRRPKKPNGKPLSAESQLVVAHYLKTHPRRKVADPKQRKAIETALATGYTVDQLCQAITGNARDAWHRERAKHEITYVLRDTDHIDSALAAFANQERPATDANGLLLPEFQTWR